MDLFKLKNYNLDKLFKNTIIDDFLDVNYIINTLYYCYTNKLPCLVTDKSLKYDNPKKDINIVFNNQVYNISWHNLNINNKFIESKYKKKVDFSLGNTIFNIFFIKYIDNNFELFTKIDKELVGYNSCIFGIYNTFQDNIQNSDNLLYYSFNLSVFVLYKIYNSKSYIIGKLVPFIKYDTPNIIINKKKIKAPSTFVSLKNNLYGIRKKIISFKIDSKKITNVNRALEKFELFNLQFNNECIYYLNLPIKLNETILKSLHKYIILTYPQFDHKNNFVYYEPENYKNINSFLSLYLKTINNKQFIILHINQLLIPYIQFIFDTIYDFFKNLTKNNIIVVTQKEFNKVLTDSHIHIVSEIYYTFFCILLYYPKTINNIKFSNNNEYIQANFIFKNEEIERLYSERNKSFEDIGMYLKSIIIKTLSIFMENYYCIVQDNDSIDLIPIYNNMSNSDILNLFKRSSKAGLSKNFLLTLLSTVFTNIKNTKLEFPVIMININKISLSDKKIEINKVYATCQNKNIPFYINIVYSVNDLHITLSYKEEYKKLKYIFNEVIEQLLEK